MLGFALGALSGTALSWLRTAHGAGALYCDRDGGTTTDISLKNVLLFAHEHGSHIAAVRFVSRAELAAMSATKAPGA